MRPVLDFGLGVLTGGLALSITWGLFWLVIGTIGFARGTCRWRVVANSLIAGFVPAGLVWALLWVSGTEGSAPGFAAGLPVIPLVLVGFGLRKAPDGQRAGIHMLDGVRNLTEELLGAHQGCGGCDHDHGHHGDCG